jgi:hypothetical protein
MLVPPCIDNTDDATSAPHRERRSQAETELVPADDPASYSGRSRRAPAVRSCLSRVNLVAHPERCRRAVLSSASENCATFRGRKAHHSRRPSPRVAPGPGYRCWRELRVAGAGDHDQADRYFACTALQREIPDERGAFSSWTRLADAVHTIASPRPGKAMRYEHRDRTSTTARRSPPCATPWRSPRTDLNGSVGMLSGVGWRASETPG